MAKFPRKVLLRVLEHILTENALYKNITVTIVVFQLSLTFTYTQVCDPLRNLLKAHIKWWCHCKLRSTAHESCCYTIMLMSRNKTFIEFFLSRICHFDNYVRLSFRNHGVKLESCWLNLCYLCHGVCPRELRKPRSLNITFYFAKSSRLFHFRFLFQFWRKPWGHKPLPLLDKGQSRAW